MATIPSIALIPSGYKAGKVYSVLPTDGTGDFDFTRSGSATRVNSQGLIELVNSNVPRLNYPLIDGVVQGCPSLLLEPQRANLYVRSNQFETTWAKLNLSVFSNNNISPDGSLNGYLLKENEINGSHDIRQNATVVSGLQYTYSIFVKKSDLGQDRNLSFYIGGPNGSISFNTTDGTFFNIGSVDSYSSESYGNGWWRLQFTDTSVSTSFNVIAILNNGSTIYTGDGVSGIYIYGAQLEQGSYATSYIPTTSAIATRSAETCNGAGDASTFNDSEGVLFAEISALVNGDTTKQISLSDGTLNNRIVFGYPSAGGSIYFEIRNAGTAIAFVSVPVASVVDISKIAVKFKNDDFALWINGIEVAIDNSGILPTGLNRLAFDNGNATGGQFYGNCKDLRVYTTALSDSELQALTQI